MKVKTLNVPIPSLNSVTLAFSGLALLLSVISLLVSISSKNHLEEQWAITSQILGQNDAARFRLGITVPSLTIETKPGQPLIRLAQSQDGGSQIDLFDVNGKHRIQLSAATDSAVQHMDQNGQVRTSSGLIYPVPNSVGIPFFTKLTSSGQIE